MTIREALHEATARLAACGIDDAPLEAEVLLRHALGLGADRAHFLTRLADPLDAATAERYQALLARRIEREPTAYITGRREFYGIELVCTPAALVPRPETELLVEAALDWLCDAAPANPLIVDLGTGSGAIALALALNAPDARVIAIDTSLDALRLARRNAQHHGIEGRVDFVAGDLLSALRVPADVVVANLPYVSERDWHALAPEIREHEPRSALVAGRRGTEAIERLLWQAPAALKPRSLLLCEIGEAMGVQLRWSAARAFPGARIEVRRDLAGLDRVLCVGP